MARYDELEGEREPTFIESASDTIWTGVKWLGVAVVAVLTLGTVFNFSPKMRKWVDEQTGGEKDGLATKAANIVRPVIDKANGIFDATSVVASDVSTIENVKGVDVPKPRNSIVSMDVNEGDIKIRELAHFSEKMKEVSRAASGSRGANIEYKINDARSRADKMALVMEAWNAEANEYNPKINRTLGITAPVFDLKTPNISENKELEKFALSFDISGWSTLSSRDKLTKLYEKMKDSPIPNFADAKTDWWNDYKQMKAPGEKMVDLGVDVREDLWGAVTRPIDSMNPEKEVKISIKKKIDSGDFSGAMEQAGKAVEYFGKRADMEADKASKSRLEDARASFGDIKEYVDNLQHKAEVEKMLGDMYNGIAEATASVPASLKEYAKQIENMKAEEKSVVSTATAKEKVQTTSKSEQLKPEEVSSGLPNNAWKQVLASTGLGQ